MSPELRAARAARKAYQAVPFPVYEGGGTKAEFDTFNETRFKPWVLDGASRWQALVARYHAAVIATSTADGKMALMGELVDVAEWTVVGLSASTIAAVPAEWRATKPTLDFATKAIDAKLEMFWLPSIVGACVDLASKLHDDGRVATRCQAIAKQLAPSETPKPALGKGDGKYAIPTHVWVATTHADGCAFGGSVRLDGEPLYADARTSTPLAKGRFDIVIDRLEPPTAAGGRYRATLSWPVAGTVWLAGDARVFELPDAVTAVASHVWIDAGRDVAGRVSAADAITLTADCPSGGCRNLASPRVAPKLETSCARVSLTGSTDPPPSTLDVDDWRVLAPRAIALSADATGPAVATFSGGGVVAALETRGDRVHVHGAGAPWTIDGWVAASDFGTKSTGYDIGIVASSDGDPHRVVADARVTVGEHGDVTPFTLPSGAVVFVTKRRDASCSVAIPSLEPASHDAPFVVDCALLEAVSAARYP
jgi:hypothetical protein